MSCSFKRSKVLVIDHRMSEEKKHGISVYGRNRAALEAFTHIADAWQLTARERCELLDLSFQTYAQGVDRLRLRAETLQRISHVLAIFQALAALFPEPARADQWIQRPNQEPPFRGRSALHVMLADGAAGIIAVRRHLERHLF